MRSDIFSGDPYIIIEKDGAELRFKGGQPIMDQGVENQAIIALFTRPNWGGNAFLKQGQKIGSDFLDAAQQPITINSLNDIEQAALRALQSSIFGTVTVDVSNPSSTYIKVLITIAPPGQDLKTISLLGNGLAWQYQAATPAHKKI